MFREKNCMTNFCGMDLTYKKNVLYYQKSSRSWLKLMLMSRLVLVIYFICSVLALLKISIIRVRRPLTPNTVERPTEKTYNFSRHCLIFLLWLRMQPSNYRLWGCYELTFCHDLKIAVLNKSLTSACYTFRIFLFSKNTKEKPRFQINAVFFKVGGMGRTVILTF